jgi:hypothetical protein
MAGTNEQSVFRKGEVTLIFTTPNFLLRGTSDYGDFRALPLSYYPEE